MKSKKYPNYGEWLNENQQIDEGKFAEWTKKMYKKGTDFTRSVIDGVKRENSETKEAVKILRKMLKGDSVSLDEKKFFKAQSADLVKIIPLVAIQGLPGAIPITKLLVELGKKYGFSVLPNSHSKISLDDLEKSKEK